MTRSSTHMHFGLVLNEQGQNVWDKPALLVTLSEFCVGKYVFTVKKAVYDDDVEPLEGILAEPEQTATLRIVEPKHLK